MAVSFEGKDKREFYRKDAAMPAIVQIDFGPRETHYRTGTILDISAGGVRISLPGHIRLGKRSSGLGILVTLPGDSCQVALECKPCRINSANGDIQIGARFAAGADFRGRRSVQRYVREYLQTQAA